MIIGIDASRANRAHKSGTEWYSYYLIRWLSKLDKKNQYILYTDKPLQGGLVDLTAIEHAGDLNILENPTKFDADGFQILKSQYNNFKARILKWPFNFFWTQGRLSLEMLFRKVDILFVPAHALPVIHPKKSIVTIHDIGFKRNRFLYISEQIGSESRKKRKAINFFVKLFTGGKYGANTLDYIRWSTKYALNHAEKIITVSNFSKQEMLSVYGNNQNKAILEKKIKVIYNGYNKFLYKKEKDADKIKMALEKYGISEPFILYIGRLEKKKNTPALVEAFAIMREKNKSIKHKLVLVGDASFGYDEVNYTIEEFLSDQESEVIMPGWIDEIDMPYIYSAASAFVFPSLYEGFGIPLLQAMASELPIAASRAVSIPEVAGDAALLFDPCNTKEMAKVLEKIITDKNLREILISRGWERVKNFSWEKCAQETLIELESL